MDSLCYPIRLSYLYWQNTQDTDIFTNQYKKAINSILKLWKKEQDHTHSSDYRFTRLNCPKSDTLINSTGLPANHTGMTWSGFRPSDDVCKFGYHIPSNFFAAKVLEYIEEISNEIYKDNSTAKEASALREEILTGIENYGQYVHPKYGKIYAYETDGFGNYNLMDDANIPSLLSLPYLGCVDINNEIYRNTRNFILSNDNKYYFKGKSAEGIGSPHTPHSHIWPLSLIMQAATSKDGTEQQKLIKTLLNTDAGTGYMHESFHADDPGIYTREWFAWANSMFAELIIKVFK